MDAVVDPAVDLLRLLDEDDRSLDESRRPISCCPVLCVVVKVWSLDPATVFTVFYFNIHKSSIEDSEGEFWYGWPMSTWRPGLHAEPLPEPAVPVMPVAEAQPMEPQPTLAVVGLVGRRPEEVLEQIYLYFGSTHFNDYWFHFYYVEISSCFVLICINSSHHESDVGFPWLSDFWRCKLGYLGSCSTNYSQMHCISVRGAVLVKLTWNWDRLRASTNPRMGHGSDCTTWPDGSCSPLEFGYPQVVHAIPT